MLQPRLNCSPPLQTFKVGLTVMDPLICAVKPQAITVFCHLPDVAAAEGGKVIDSNADAHSNELHTRHINNQNAT